LGLFSIKITLFGRQKRHPQEKDGVFSEENEVFRVEKRSFSTTNSSFFRKKTPFSDRQNAVFFQSVFDMFAISCKTTCCQPPQILGKFRVNPSGGKFASHEVKGIENR